MPADDISICYSLSVLLQQHLFCMYMYVAGCPRALYDGGRPVHLRGLFRRDNPRLQRRHPALHHHDAQASLPGCRRGSWSGLQVADTLLSCTMPCSSFDVTKRQIVTTNATPFSQIFFPEANVTETFVVQFSKRNIQTFLETKKKRVTTSVIPSVAHNLKSSAHPWSHLRTSLPKMAQPKRF